MQNAMMKFFLLVNLIAASWTMNSAWADAGGSCHFHGRKEATEDILIRCATYHRQRLVKKRMLEPSWSNLNHESIEKVLNSKGKSEWRIVFAHPALTDETKKKLYVFFTLNGNFIAANHTGK